MARTFVCWLGVAAGLALQTAQAGDRESTAVQTHHRASLVQSVAVAAPPRFGRKPEVTDQKPEVGGSATAGKLRSAVGMGTTRHGEFSFVPVTPLGADPPSSRNRGTTARQGENGPSTSPRERKSITFFRLDPKLGDVSVQPVVGGVNGAQLSVGF